MVSDGRNQGADSLAPVGDDRSVALVHDYLLVMRGAERTFAAITHIWPEAPIHTLLYDERATEGRFTSRRVLTSPLQSLGVDQSSFRRLLPLMPPATRLLGLAGHDLVISSSSAFAHGVRVDPGARHVCYCHSPFRYAWHERERALDEAPAPLRPPLAGTLRAIRSWDRHVARGQIEYVANSAITQERIARFWGRTSRIVHPPVDVDRFHAGEPEDYLLVVCELVRHKRVELALAAARRAGRPIRVVGTGPDLQRLRDEYGGGGATFLGRLGDAELTELYARALAVVVPNVEEFGIAAVEAQAAGRPVVGMDAGGTRETVAPGKTGVLVAPENPEALASALRGTDFESFVASDIQAHARRFSTASFQRRLLDEVERVSAGRRDEPATQPTPRRTAGRSRRPR